MIAEQLIAELYRARTAAKEAKALFVIKAAEVGRCQETVPEYHDAGLWQDEPAVCYMHRPDDPGEWCDICTAKQPLWKDWQHKSRMAGAVLRKLLTFGKVLEAIK